MSYTLWKFKTAQFTIAAEAHECDDLYLSWDESGEVADKLDRGIYEAFDVVVSVRHAGHEIGFSSLGQCIYERPQEFVEGHRDADPLNRNCTTGKVMRGGSFIGHYFPDMVAEACKEAREYLRAYEKPYMRAA